MPRLNQAKTDARDAREFADWLTACTFDNESEDTMDPIALLPRRSMDTEAQYRSKSASRPTCPITRHLIVELASGKREYRVGDRVNVRAAYAAERGDDHIINLRLVSQPLHLLTA